MASPVIPPEMLREANRDYGTRGRVRRDAERVAIVCDDEVVGFYSPHRAASGHQRIGPVYVRPAWRRRGLVMAVYLSIKGPMMACLEDTNAESITLHEKAGFVRLRRYSHGWYWHRP